MKQLKNNWYMLKIMWSASPKRLVWEVLDALLNTGVEIIYTLFFLRFIIECLQKNTAFSTVLIYIFIYFFINIISRAIHSYLVNVIVPESNVLIQSKLMEKIYNQALRVDLSCYENAEFYDTYTKANEELVDRSTSILENLYSLFSRMISIGSYTVAVLVYEPIILPILIGAIIATNYLNKHYVKEKYDRYKYTVAQRRKMDYVKRVVYLQDFAKDLRLSNVFDPILKNFHIAAEDMREKTKAYGKRAGIFRLITAIVSSLGVYLVVQSIIIYRYIAYHAYGLGVLTTIINAANSLSDSLLGLAWGFAQFSENGTFISNFREFIEYEPKIIDGADRKVPKKSKNDVELCNVTFAYEGAKNPTLKNINMDIKAGQKIALVGHNGAGKSTLVKLLMRLYDVSEGEIKLDGTNIKEYELKSYRDLFGTIFQDFKIFAASVSENVLLSKINGKAEEERVIKALKESGIYHKINELPDKINSTLTKEFDEDGILMSGGEHQKLAIARVFAKECSIAILDEPSSALDPISEYEIFENMMKACEGKTVIFVSHRLSSATLADTIYMMEHGEIIEKGSHHELMMRNGKYADMFHKQAEKYKEEGGYHE